MVLTKEYLNKIEITPDLDTLRLQKIDDEEYFSEKYNGYISNSRLNLIDPDKEGSPEKFFEGKSKIYSDSLSLGSAVHEICLQNELFHLAYGLEKPSAKAGICADEYYPYFLKNDSKQYYYEHITEITERVGYYVGLLNDKKKEDLYDKCINYWNNRRNYKDTDTIPIFLDDRMAERAIACIDAINNDRNIQVLLKPDCISENEQAILLDINVKFEDESFKLRLKAKLDNYTINQDSNEIVVNDIKTIGKILSEFSTNAVRFSYYREISFYTWLLSLVVKKYYNMSDPIIKGNFLVVSTIPDYYTKVFPMTTSNFKEGWNELVRLLKLVAYYYMKGYRFD